jgi:hypothetical protein
MKEGDHLKDNGVDGSIILKWSLQNDDDVKWIHVALDRGQWQDLMNTIINLLFS